jgi:hypothetical protein
VERAFHPFGLATSSRPKFRQGFLGIGVESFTSNKPSQALPEPLIQNRRDQRPISNQRFVSPLISPLDPGTATHIDKLTWLRARCHCGLTNLANLLSRLKQVDEVPSGVEQPNLRTTRPGYYIIANETSRQPRGCWDEIFIKKSPTKAQKLMRKSKIQLFSYCG